jgi:hypothetical protein
MEKWQQNPGTSSGITLAKTLDPSSLAEFMRHFLAEVMPGFCCHFSHQFAHHLPRSVLRHFYKSAPRQGLAQPFSKVV